MKAKIAAAVVAIAVASPALAGGPVVVVQEPQPVYVATPAAVADWSGFYAGLHLGRTNDVGVSAGGTSVDFEDGTAYGIQLGYLAQRNSFVYGGELSYTKFDGAELDIGGGAFAEAENAIDLKARLGYATGSMLFYGVAGYGKADFSAPGIDASPDGFIWGLGADWAVSDRWSVGIEYMNRDLSEDVMGVDVDFDASSVALRTNWRF